jgi:hypothetical protein
MRHPQRNAFTAASLDRFGAGAGQALPRFEMRSLKK